MSTILVADDNPGMQELLPQLFKRQGHEVVVVTNGDAAVAAVSAQSFDLVVSDIRMPGSPWSEILSAARRLNPDVQLILITGYASVQTAVEAVNSQVAAFVIKPFRNEDFLRTAAEVLGKGSEQARRRQRLEQLQGELRDRFRFDSLVGSSPVMLEVYKLMRKVLDIPSSVLIEGESGTGKELVAQAIHYNGPRRHEPFVAIDCGSIPESLLESELFGHKRGSFTGAGEDKIGLFEAAHGGTVFLDEIAEMSAALQGKLLRVLELGEIRRIGESAPRLVNVRVIAATNRPLDSLVHEKEFRQDLYFRLKVITVLLPPLRDRRDDIPLLAQHFVKAYAKKLARPVERISPDAFETLTAYSWPGNVRELQHVIERAVALSSGNEIRPDDLPDHVRGTTSRHAPSGIELPDEGIDLNRLLRDIESDLVRKALARTGGVKEQAARLLGLNRTTLVEKLKRIS